MPGGIAPADHNDLRPSAQLRFRRGGGVVDAQALELFAPWDVQFSIVRTRRDQHASSRDVLAIIEPEDGPAFVELQACNLRGGRELGTEFLGLQNGAVRKFGAGNAGREAKVVLDLRGSTGLSARGVRVDHGGGESFRRCVHGRSQPRRTATDNHQVIDPLRERSSDPDEVGQCPRRWIPQ